MKHVGQTIAATASLNAPASKQRAAGVCRLLKIHPRRRHWRKIGGRIG